MYFAQALKPVPLIIIIGFKTKCTDSAKSLRHKMSGKNTIRLFTATLTKAYQPAQYGSRAWRLGLGLAYPMRFRRLREEGSRFLLDKDAQEVPYHHWDQALEALNTLYDLQELVDMIGGWQGQTGANPDLITGKDIDNYNDVCGDADTHWKSA